MSLSQSTKKYPGVFESSAIKQVVRLAEKFDHTISQYCWSERPERERR